MRYELVLVVLATLAAAAPIDRASDENYASYTPYSAYTTYTTYPRAAEEATTKMQDGMTLIGGVLIFLCRVLTALQNR